MILSKSFAELLNSLSKEYPDDKIISTLIEALKGDTAFSGDYITMNRSGDIRFMPKNKKQEIREDGTWESTGRQTTTLGRFLNKIMGDSWKSHEINALVSRIMCFKTHGRLPKMEILDSSCIEEVYDNGPDSCMAGEPVGDFYSLFDTKIAVVRGKDGDYLARTILWEKVYNAPGKPPVKTFQGIYVKEDAYELRPHMESHLKSLGYVPMSSVFPAIVKCNDPKEMASISFYPYQDYLYYMDRDFKYLSNSEEVFGDGNFYCLGDTNGCFSSTPNSYRPKYIVDAISKSTIPYNIAVNIDGFPVDPKRAVLKENGEYALTNS